jgi:hypothetical protein
MKRKSPRIAVALATSGLTGSCDSGSVDPLPPPLRCDDVGEGQSLQVTATVAEQTLTAIIGQGDAFWTEATVTEVVGGSLVSSEISNELVTVVLALDAAPPTSGSFTLAGVLQGFTGTVCQVQRTFDFTVDGQDVQIAGIPLSDESLPLAVRHPAEIRLIARDGRWLELEGRTSYGGSHELFWRAYAGALRVRGSNRAEWKLPAEPGFYQVELMVDYGPGGLALDWLTFEVT